MGISFCRHCKPRQTSLWIWMNDRCHADPYSLAVAGDDGYGPMRQSKLLWKGWGHNSFSFPLYSFICIILFIYGCYFPGTQSFVFFSFSFLIFFRSDCIYYTVILHSLRFCFPRSLGYMTGFFQISLTLLDGRFPTSFIFPYNML